MLALSISWSVLGVEHRRPRGNFYLYWYETNSPYIRSFYMQTYVESYLLLYNCDVIFQWSIHLNASYLCA
jgi:hypothetical protein